MQYAKYSDLDCCGDIVLGGDSGQHGGFHCPIGAVIHLLEPSLIMKKDIFITGAFYTFGFTENLKST